MPFFLARKEILGSPSGNVMHLGHTPDFPFRLQGEIWDGAQVLVIRFHSDLAAPRVWW